MFASAVSFYTVDPAKGIPISTAGIGLQLLLSTWSECVHESQHVYFHDIESYRCFSPYLLKAKVDFSFPPASYMLSGTFTGSRIEVFKDVHVPDLLFPITYKLAIIRGITFFDHQAILELKLLINTG